MTGTPLPQACPTGWTKIRIQKHPAVVQPTVVAHGQGLADRAPEDHHPENEAEKKQAKSDEDPPVIGHAKEFASKGARTATTSTSPSQHHHDRHSEDDWKK